jgi:hypothetical protein
VKPDPIGSVLERIIIAPLCVKSDSLVDKMVWPEILQITDSTSAARPKITMIILFTPEKLISCSQLNQERVENGSVPSFVVFVHFQ